MKNSNPEFQSDDHVSYSTVPWLKSRILTKNREAQVEKIVESPLMQHELICALYNEVIKLRNQNDQLLAPHYKQVKPDPFDIPTDEDSEVTKS